ncbi:MAG: hypothetical protein ACN4GM_09755 [Gammaproteobacteria bacterium]
MDGAQIAPPFNLVVRGKGIMIQKALKTSTLLFAIIFPIIVTANSLSDEERKVRKYVSRFYQVTDGALGRCSSDYIGTFKVTLDKFKSTYPELMSLVNNSKYYQRAVNNFADDIERSKSETQKKLSRECQYVDYLLKEMLNTEKGKNSVLNAIKIIKN